MLHGLRGMSGAEAPASLLPSVLARVGLADAYWEMETPVGPVFIAYNQAGISAVMRTGSAEQFEREFRARHGRPARRTPTPPRALAEAVSARLRGNTRAQLEFDLRGLSEFERAVLLKALEIPHGEVRPYAWIAKEIGRPTAVRAVGGALGGNPIPLLIPCHRVVRTDGRIGEYALGSEVKRAVLQAEGAAPEVIERIARAGIRLLGNSEERTYCLPTCEGMHLTTNPYRVSFHSEREALDAGYHPCATCRPALLAS